LGTRIGDGWRSGYNQATDRRRPGDSDLIHGSAPNTSGRRRAGVAIRYMPTTSWFRRDLEMQLSGYPSNFKDRPIWLARGRDVCGRNDFTIGHTDSGPGRAAASA